MYEAPSKLQSGIFWPEKGILPGAFAGLYTTRDRTVFDRITQAAFAWRTHDGGTSRSFISLPYAEFSFRELPTRAPSRQQDHAGVHGEFPPQGRPANHGPVRWKVHRSRVWDASQQRSRCCWTPTGFWTPVSAQDRRSYSPHCATCRSCIWPGVARKMRRSTRLLWLPTEVRLNPCQVAGHRHQQCLWQVASIGVSVAAT
jgi:hypothetical protein